MAQKEPPRLLGKELIAQIRGLLIALGHGRSLHSRVIVSSRFNSTRATVVFFSNFGVAYGMLISQLPGVRADQVHRMPAEAEDIDAAAMGYEGELRASPMTRTPRDGY